MTAPLPHGWRLRPLARADAPLLAPVINDSVRMFGRGDVFSVDELDAMLGMPSLDPPRDGRLILDEAGAVAGVVVCMTAEPWTTAHVFPSVGARPRRREVLELLADLGGELAAGRPELGAGALLEASAVPEEDQLLREVLERRGYGLVRRAVEMVRSLRDEADTSGPLPPGIVLEPIDPADDVRLAALAELQREAFADHDGDYAMTAADFVHMVQSTPTLRPDLSVVALEHGRPVGLTLSLSDVSDAQGRTGYVSALGVARHARGRGVATAMLGECFRAFRREGWTTARLHVQVGNRTGADRLYRAVGMEPRFVDLSYERPLH